MILKKRITILFIFLIIGSLFSFNLISAIQQTTDEEDETEYLDTSQYLDEDGHAVFTEDTIGPIELTSDVEYYNPEGQGFTGYSGEADIENGVVTGGLFHAETNPSLLQINNDFGFDLTYEMYEGDTLEVTDTTPNGLELDYLMNQLENGIQALIQYTNGATQLYTALEDDSLFLIYEDGKFEIMDGLLTFEYGDLFQSVEADDEKTEIIIDSEGIKKVILYPNKTFSMKNNYLNITILNTEDEEFTICTEEGEDCQATLINNVLTTEGELIVLQDGIVFYESFHPNNILVYNFEAKEFTFNNLNPRNKDYNLAYIYNGHHVITETTDMTYSKMVKEEHPITFTYYNSELTEINFTIRDQILEIENIRKYIP